MSNLKTCSVAYLFDSLLKHCGVDGLCKPRYCFAILKLSVAHYQVLLSSVCYIGTVQPKNNARARSGERRSCTARTRKRQKEVKLRFIRKKFKAQEVQNPTRKKPQEVENVN